MTTKREITWAAVLSCTAGICVSGSALAVVKNYNAPLIGNVSAGGNWTPAGAPTTSDNWIFPALAIYTVTFDGPAADGSLELAFNAPATVTVFNTGATHVTPLMRVGGIGASATVSVNSGSFQPDELLVASLQAGIIGNLSFRNAGTILRMEDNGLVRIGDNIGCDGTLGLFNGAVMTDETNPPGVPTDTGRIVLGADGKIVVSDAEITLDEWDLDMTAGGSVTLSNNAVVEVGDLDMGATSVIRGAGTLEWSSIDSVPGSLVENIGDLFLSHLGISETPHTLRVNPGLVSFNRSSVVWNGFGATPGIIQLNGGTLEVQDSFGGIGPVTNFSASTISGFGIIDADIDNDGSILPSGTGLTIRGKFMQPAGSVTGSVITLANTAAFEGKGNVNAGFTVPAGVNVTLTGDAQFGTFGAAAAAGINMDGNVFLGGFNALFRDIGLIDFTGTTDLQGGTLGVVNGGRITASAELNGPGTIGGDWQVNGLLSTNGTLNTIAGNLTLGAAADTQLFMRNTAAGGFGSISVAAPGVATLNGNLEIVLRDSFDYVDGDVFVIVNAPGGRVGNFTGVTFTNTRNGAVFNVVYAANAVRLRVVRGGCDSIDFNNNDVFPEDQDVIDFFDVLAGGSPGTCDPVRGCNGIDFNNNGVFPEDQDVIDFFNVLAGGAC